jgi:hypothetical protein
MAKSGDWGGDPAAVRKKVRVTSNENFHGTTPDAQAVPGPAPKLKVYSEPWYDRAPFDPEFKNLNAKGTDDYHGNR